MCGIRAPPKPLVFLFVVAMGVMPAAIPALPAMTATVLRTILATVIPSLTEWLSAVVAVTTSTIATAILTTTTAVTATQGVVVVTPAGAAGSAVVPAAVATSAMVGHLLREGVVSLSPKLMKRITSLELLEIVDLLPETLLLEEMAMEAQLRR